jgi:hypothetical protein
MFALATVKAQANTKNAIIFFITDSVLFIINKRHMFAQTALRQRSMDNFVMYQSNKKGNRNAWLASTMANG